MPGPAPSPAPARRNRIATAAQLEAPAATKVPLPQRFSDVECLGLADRKDGCPLPSEAHILEWFAKLEVEPHPFVAKPIDWHELTVLWWDTIWQSPMAQLWIDADVPHLVALAILWDRYWRTSNSALMAEIRLTGREFGLSDLARRGLHWQVHVTPGPGPKGGLRLVPPPTPIRAKAPRGKKAADPRSLLK